MDIWRFSHLLQEVDADVILIASTDSAISAGFVYCLNSIVQKIPKTGWLIRLWRLKSVLIYIFRLQINKFQGRSGKKKTTPSGMAFFFCTKIMQNDKKK